jgi:hypothetical protein
MQGSNALDIYDGNNAEKSLKMLFNDKSNEFRELAQWWVSYLKQGLGIDNFEFLS